MCQNIYSIVQSAAIDTKDAYVEVCKTIAHSMLYVMYNVSEKVYLILDLSRYHIVNCLIIKPIMAPLYSWGLRNTDGFETEYDDGSEEDDEASEEDDDSEEDGEGSPLTLPRHQQRDSFIL